MKVGDAVIYYRFKHGVIPGAHAPEKLKAKVIGLTKKMRARIELEDGSVRTVLLENLVKDKDGT